MNREPPLPVVAGIYFLFKDRELVYTGKSRSAYARIAEHRRNGRQFDFAMVSACPEAEMAWVEAALIRAFSPPENRALKAKPPRPDPRPRGRPPVQVTELRPIPPKQTDVLPEDPDMVVSMVVAVDYARHFKLQTPIRAAIKDGTIPHRRLTQRGAFLVRVGDVREWCRANSPLYQSKASDAALR